MFAYRQNPLAERFDMGTFRLHGVVLFDCPPIGSYWLRFATFGITLQVSPFRFCHLMLVSARKAAHPTRIRRQLPLYKQSLRRVAKINSKGYPIIFGAKHFKEVDTNNLDRESKIEMT